MWRRKLHFTHRAYLSEWMDEPCTYEDFRACLRDLQQSNTVTLSRRSTLGWLRRLPRQASAPLHIVDVGCGGGDTLRHIERAARRWKLPVRLTGIDLNPYAARAAREFTPAGSEIEWVTGDAFSYAGAPVDIVISSLFTHHLPDAEIVQFLRWMTDTARVGWFINDLSRAAVPYYAYTLLSRAARWHRFVQHDGPISLRRAFREEDWQSYLQAAGLGTAGAVIQPVWPARLCVGWLRAG